jgi:hypothetical protein
MIRIRNWKMQHRRVFRGNAHQAALPNRIRYKVQEVDGQVREENSGWNLRAEQKKLKTGSGIKPPGYMQS